MIQISVMAGKRWFEKPFQFTLFGREQVLILTPSHTQSLDLFLEQYTSHDLLTRVHCLLWFFFSESPLVIKSLKDAEESTSEELTKLRLKKVSVPSLWNFCWQKPCLKHLNNNINETQTLFRGKHSYVFTRSKNFVGENTCIYSYKLTLIFTHSG